MLAVLNSLWRSTLARRIAGSRTAFLNKVEFLKFLESRRKSFRISFYEYAFTGLRFPAQELVRADAKVPSLLYYDKSGNFRAAGAETLTESVIQTALIEKWTMAEWLVVDNVEALNITHIRPGGSFISAQST